MIYAVLLAGVVGALFAGAGVAWYYGRRQGDLRGQLARAEGEGEALKVERADRSAAEGARNAALEGRWEQEAKEAASAQDVSVVFGRWGRTLRYRRLPRP